MRARYALAPALVFASLAACSHATPYPSVNASPDSIPVGYGRESRETITGSVSSVSGKELARVRAGRLEELLEGQVPGLQVLRLPNGDFSLRIRGMGTFSGSNEPLIVVDGMPTTSSHLGSVLVGLNPGDVERVEVLKDAGSTGIYGVRGANGVILITTKR
jgi:TonB-dependent SusC/RagA subfamily outer membrane receptor